MIFTNYKSVLIAFSLVLTALLSWKISTTKADYPSRVLEFEFDVVGVDAREKDAWKNAKLTGRLANSSEVLAAFGVVNESDLILERDYVFIGLIEGVDTTRLDNLEYTLLVHFAADSLPFTLLKGKGTCLVHSLRFDGDLPAKHSPVPSKAEIAQCRMTISKSSER